MNLRELSKLKNPQHGVFNQILEQLPPDAENYFKHDESFRKLATAIEVALELFTIESLRSTQYRLHFCHFRPVDSDAHIRWFIQVLAVPVRT